MYNNEAMKKIKNTAKHKRHEAKKARKKRTVAEQKTRSANYRQKLIQKREKEKRDFAKFSEFMQSARNQQTGEGGFVPNFGDTSENAKDE
jgi:hypothetical protein